MEIKKIDRDKIIKEIKDAGYKEDQLIDYKKLQELCRSYGRGLKEVEFAQSILGITYGNYMNCKNKGTKARILKSQEKIITEKEREEIIEEIRRAGYNSGQLIEYKELQELYRMYGRRISELNFAQSILGITYANYGSCKNKGTRVRILKKIITEEERKEKIKEIKDAGYIEGQLIDYEELKQMCQKYGRGFKESDFAQNVLGITYVSYFSCKNGGRRVRILKKIIAEEERKEIIKQIKDAGYKEGQLIDYEELKQMCQKYGRGLKERDFIQYILGITYGNYSSCKYRGKRVRILKIKEKIVTGEERKEIIKEIKEAGYKEGQLIDYEELKQMCQKYGRGLKEEELAQSILGITYSNFMRCKNGGTKVRILKNNRKIITEEEQIEIIEKIRKAGYKEGQLIDYEELKQMCMNYGRGLKEEEFAQTILGVTYSNYRNCKNIGTNIIIKNAIVMKMAEEIKAIYINKPQYYSEEDIEEICKEYNITIDDFITYVYLGNFHDIQPFKDALESNRRLWIGKTRMSKEFVNEIIGRFEEITLQIAKSICSKYRIKQKTEDYKQELIIYIIENMGDLERNLGNTEELFNIIIRKTKKYCESIILSNIKIAKRFEGFYKTSRRGKEDNTFEVQYADESIDIESQVEEKIDRESIDVNENEMEKCINLIKKCIERGMSKSESLKETASQMNIDVEIMLEYMQSYLIEKGKVKVVKGKIIPGEPSIPEGEDR